MRLNYVFNLKIKKPCFIGIKLNEPFLNFENTNNESIDKFLYLNCVKHPNNQITQTDLYFEINKYITNIDPNFVLSTSDKIKIDNYFDNRFLRCKVGQASKGKDERKHGWFGLSLKNNVINSFINYGSKQNSLLCQEVLQIDSKNNILKTFSSQYEAAQFLNLNISVFCIHMKKRAPIVNTFFIFSKDFKNLKNTGTDTLEIV